MHYGEYIRDVDRLRKVCNNADIVIIMGSSCVVLKHYKFIYMNSSGESKFIININTQTTSLDKISNIKVHADCDTFMKALLNSLSIIIK